MMEPRRARSPRPDPPAGRDDPRAATVAQLRPLRRWLVVAAVWATAATAIAVIALVVADRNRNADESARVAGRLGQVERRLDERIDTLEARMEELPQSRDLANLDNRLRDLEAGAAASSNRMDELSRRLDELENRVRELERGAGSSPTRTTP
jgi:hypothetical protein